MNFEKDNPNGKRLHQVQRRRFRQQLKQKKLVFTIVKDWIELNNPSFEELQKTFPDELQGSKGVVKKEAVVKDPKRYNVREPLKIKNGAYVVVCNHWVMIITNTLKTLLIQ